MAGYAVAKSIFNPEAAAYQPLSITTSPSAVTTEDKPKRVTSLLGLPIEVRQMIYDELLRPDLYSFYNWSYQGKSQNAVGCTNILLLNRQTYSEARPVIQTMSNSIVLKGNGRKVFRHPLANGRPSFFHSYARCSTSFVPDSLSELEFINLRRATLVLFEDTAALDIAEVFRAVKKSKTLQAVKLKCQVSCAEQGRRGAPRAYTNWNVVKQIRSAIRPLVLHCIAAGIKLTAIENIDFKNSYPYHGAPRTFYFPEYRDPLVKYINDFTPLQKSNDRIEEAAEQAKHKQEDRPEFELTPECRHCYAVFATTQDLKHHLSRFPKHNITFIKKKYNWIHPLAKAGGDRHACLVCGRNYHSESFLDKHIENYGHYRDRKEQGLVPRFVKDNGWYKCTGLSCSMDEE